MSASPFFAWLNANGPGLFTLFALLAGLAVIVQWFTWIAGVGRFKPDRRTSDRGRALRFVFSEAAIKIINDFRHLLALLIVLLFASALFYMVGSAGTYANRVDALKTVAATLGGLVGSIIGYYFGEAAASSTAAQVAAGQASGGGNGTPLPEAVEQPTPVPEALKGQPDSPTTGDATSATGATGPVVPPDPAGTSGSSTDPPAPGTPPPPPVADPDR